MLKIIMLTKLLCLFNDEKIMNNAIYATITHYIFMTTDYSLISYERKKKTNTEKWNQQVKRQTCAHHSYCFLVNNVSFHYKLLTNYLISEELSENYLKCTFVRLFKKIPFQLNI